MKYSKIFSFALVILFAVVPAGAEPNLDKLSSRDINQVQSILKKLSPVIQQRRSSRTLVTMTFEDVFKPLSKEQCRLLNELKNLDGNELDIKLSFRGIAQGVPELVSLKGQKVKSRGKVYELPIQYLPADVNAAYCRMMDAMQKGTGKRLLVESGYRSSAYQLYLFVKSLTNHKYSIRETAKFVALPGYSEHGDPNRQGMDFINEDGINQDTPKVFVNLPEYEWLLKNGASYGFVLSYPKDSKDGISFEPWHWHYEKPEIPKN
jgi:hypothetical protein